MELSRRQFVQCTAAGLLLGRASQAGAEGLETAKVVIGFAPGGTTDRLARTDASAPLIRLRTCSLGVR